MRTLTRLRKMCLAQFKEEENTSEREGKCECEYEYGSGNTVAGWLQIDPFQPRAVRRLSVGATRMGKTVGAQAAASRVLGAYPYARVVIFASIPGSFDRVDDLLDVNAGPRGDSPRAERMWPGDLAAQGDSLAELPAVSIVEPRKAGDCESLAHAFDRFTTRLYEYEDGNTDKEMNEDTENPPVYLIVDDADQLLSASKNTDFRDLMPATREDSIAIHVLAQRADVEQIRPFPEHYTAIDLYRAAGAENASWQRRCGVSKDDATFLNQHVNGPRQISAVEESERSESAWTLARRAAPTGLCYTRENGWNRVRYTLFNAEMEALLDHGGHRASFSFSEKQEWTSDQ